MNSKKILIISHGSFEKQVLERISEAIAGQLDFEVDFIESQMDLSKHYDPARRQYNGNSLLLEIDSINSPEYHKKIGLFRVDLFIPILTYIFGQASFSGSSGIVSLYRLRNEQYGMKRNDSLLVDRFRKVIIHELGHTMGLVHCLNPSCVMRSSTYVEDIDQKKIDFCPACRTKILR